MRIVGVGAVHEHAVQHAQLRGGEAHAERVVHQLPHPLDLLLKGLVEALHRQRGRAQHRVAELAHAAQRRVAAGPRLGVELGGRRRVLLALDLDIGLLGGPRPELLERVFLGCVVLCGHDPLSL